LIQRVSEHREGLVPGFTKWYDIKRLVYFEEHGDIHEARRREKAIKAVTSPVEARSDREQKPTMARSLD